MEIMLVTVGTPMVQQKWEQTWNHLLAKGWSLGRVQAIIDGRQVWVVDATHHETGRRIVETAEELEEAMEKITRMIGENEN